MSSQIARQSSPASERRRFRRFAVRCECWLERDEASVYGTTADVGLGGLFLRTAVPLPHGHPVDVILDIEGAAEKVVANGVVTRAVPAQVGLRHGVGVEFLDITGGRAILEGFLDEQPTA